MEQLRAYLKERGMSQLELAKQVNRSQSSVSDWINGRGMPDRKTLVRLCEITGFTADELLRLDTQA